MLDRDQMRARLGAADRRGRRSADGVPSLGPRPWRLVAGVLLGLACAVKWTALSFFVLFVLLSLLWDRARFKVGRRYDGRRASPLHRILVPALGSLWSCADRRLPVHLVGLVRRRELLERHWADSHERDAHSTSLGIRIPFNWGFPAPGSGRWARTPRRVPVPRGARFAARVRVQALELAGPRAARSASTTTAAPRLRCERDVRGRCCIGTPVLWWAFIPMLLWLAWRCLPRRDWRAAAVLVAFVAGWVVWFQDLKRTMFLFYMAPLVPFLVLGLTLGLGVMLGPATRPVVDPSDRASILAERRWKWGVFGISAYLGLLIVDFAWMWPLFSGGLLTYDQWHNGICGSRPGSRFLLAVRPRPRRGRE